MATAAPPSLRSTPPPTPRAPGEETQEWRSSEFLRLLHDFEQAMQVSDQPRAAGDIRRMREIAAADTRFAVALEQCETRFAALPAPPPAAVLPPVAPPPPPVAAPAYPSPPPPGPGPAYPPPPGIGSGSYPAAAPPPPPPPSGVGYSTGTGSSSGAFGTGSGSYRAPGQGSGSYPVATPPSGSTDDATRMMDQGLAGGMPPTQPPSGPSTPVPPPAEVGSQTGANICFVCGTGNSSGSKFCIKCGSTLRPKTPPPPSGYSTPVPPSVGSVTGTAGFPSAAAPGPSPVQPGQQPPHGFGPPPAGPGAYPPPGPPAPGGFTPMPPGPMAPPGPSGLSGSPIGPPPPISGPGAVPPPGGPGMAVPPVGPPPPGNGGPAGIQGPPGALGKGALPPEPPKKVPFPTQKTLFLVGGAVLLAIVAVIAINVLFQKVPVMTAVATAVVSSEQASIYESQNTTSKVLVDLKRGESVNVIAVPGSRNDEWVNVQYVVGNKAKQPAGYIQFSALRDFNGLNPDVGLSLARLYAPSDSANEQELREYLSTLEAFIEKNPSAADQQASARLEMAQVRVRLANAATAAGQPPEIVTNHLDAASTLLSQVTSGPQQAEAQKLRSEIETMKGAVPAATQTPAQTPAPQQTPVITPQQELARAQFFFEKGQYNAALNSINRYLQAFPNDARGQNLRGRIEKAKKFEGQ